MMHVLNHAQRRVGKIKLLHAGAVLVQPQKNRATRGKMFPKHGIGEG